MIENLSQYWDKADRKTKKKILGCIFKEKFEDFNFERCNHIFTPEIESIMLASEVLQKNKKEVKNDLLSKIAPPIDRSCSFITLIKFVSIRSDINDLL
jgi:hypothetical protein